MVRTDCEYFHGSGKQFIYEEMVVNLTVKTVPSPSALLTEIEPPCFSTIAFVIDNPSPVPEERIFRALSALKNSLNICGSASSGMPIPVSATVKITYVYRAVFWSICDSIRDEIRYHSFKVVFIT